MMRMRFKGLHFAAIVIVASAAPVIVDTFTPETPVPVVEVQPAPAESPAPIQEDDPGWDCRTMGNLSCGVEVEGEWYVITFDAKGKPVAVRER